MVKMVKQFPKGLYCNRCGKPKKFLHPWCRDIYTDSPLAFVCGPCLNTLRKLARREDDLKQRQD